MVKSNVGIETAHKSVLTKEEKTTHVHLFFLCVNSSTEYLRNAYMQSVYMKVNLYSGCLVHNLQPGETLHN